MATLPARFSSATASLANGLIGASGNAARVMDPLV
jgi:hypothetical protein